MAIKVLSDKQLAAVQKIGEAFMRADVVITHRVHTMTKDPTNPFGDDDVSFEPITTTVKGWIKPIIGSNFDQGVGMVYALGEFWLRVPAGTQMDPHDEILVNGIGYVIVDDNVEQSWPEWSVARLRRIQ